MTAAPISMHHLDHHDVEATTWVVQSHVLSMYLPSLFTGHVIARFGERKVMMWGGALLASCAGVSLFGHQLMHYWLGLVTLGLGWNLLFVAGTTLLSRSVDPASRHRAQALNDFVGVRLASVRIAARRARRAADRLAGAESRHAAAAGRDDLHREPPAARREARPHPCAPFRQSRARERRLAAADPLARRAAHRPHRPRFSRRSGRRHRRRAARASRSTRGRITR